MRMPVASWIAFAMAGIGGTMGTSPTPRTPYGCLGFGTSTPVADLHIKSGNTPTLRLEQDGSPGFTPQTWDVAGNEANYFIRDATNGSTLPFRIRPGAPTSAITFASPAYEPCADRPCIKFDQHGFSVIGPGAVYLREGEQTLAITGTRPGHFAMCEWGVERWK